MKKNIFSAKLIFTALFFAFANVLLCAIDIDKTELGKSQGQVEFESNPASSMGRINSIEEIRAIGKSLARSLISKDGKRIQNAIVGDKARYFMKEVADAKTTDADGLSADIIMLGRQAGVDTVTNLRHILSGYIEEAFRYSKNISDEIAVYVTVYNAINRKSLDRFNEFYKKEVVKDLDVKILGLSPSFREWPAGTQIIIPLYDPDSNGNMVIELKEVVNEKVVAEMKKNPVKGANPEKFNHSPPPLPPPPPPTKAQLLEAARSSTAKAQNELLEYERRLKEAQNAASLERENQKALEEKLKAAQAEYEKANVNVVKNKFGDPIKGNESSKAAANEIAVIKKALSLHGAKIRKAEAAVDKAENELQDAKEALAKRKAEEDAARKEI